jgi:hypothetical protein
MPAPEDVRSALAPFARAVANLDLTSPALATLALTEQFPPSALRPVRELLKAANQEGWLTPKRASETLTFGRLAKPAEDLGNCSIDVVDMSGAGASHTHPNGEVNLAFTLDGDPRFIGRPEGWIVEPPGSHHVPEVTGGRMLIVYFLPGGAMVWE